MGKYIDRAALFNSLTNAKTVAEVFAAIQDAPAADVQEIRRGRWIDITKCGGNSVFKCSECGDLQLEESYYCPNCGAQMDLEENDD